jgi:hypothetical protein
MQLLRHAWLLGLALILTTTAWAQPQRPDRSTPYPQARPALGETAPDFTLQDLDGKEVRLRDLVGKRPIIIEFGSYS